MKDLVIKVLRSRPVAYLPDITKAAGSVKAGLFLSQLLYWADKSNDGWVFRTQEYKETGLSRREQEGARRILKRAGVLEEKREGIPAKVCYRVNYQRLAEILQGGQ